MADFNEHIRIFVSSVSDVTGIRSFRTEVAAADGIFGKFKAGASSIFSTIGQNAGLAAAVIGIGLVKAGLDATKAFDDTALAARNLASHVGLTVEEASRWIGASKDLGVSTDTLYFGLSRIAKTMDTSAEKWANYGIQVRNADGSARSVSAILLDTIGTLEQVSNVTQRASIGNDLFGRGYNKISPLIDHGRASVEAYLAAVESGQVITDAELAKAEENVKANKDLQQSFHAISLSVGQLLTSLSPLIGGLAKVVNVVSKVVSVALDLTFATKSTVSANEAFTESVNSSDVSVRGAILGFKHLVDAHIGAQSNFQKTEGLFNAIIGVTDLSEERFRVLRNTFIELAKSSPEAASRTVVALRELLKEAEAGDKGAQDMASSYGLTAASLKDLTGIANEYGAVSKDGVLTSGQAKDAADALAASQAEDAAALKKLKDAQDAVNKVVEDARKAADDYKKSMDDIRKAQIDSIDHTGDYEQSIRDVEDAYAKLKTSTEENIATQADSTISDDVKAQSTRDLASDTHDLMGKVYDAAKAYSESRGSIQGSTADIKDRIGFLEAEKVQYPELAAQFDTYISRLKAKLPDVQTNVQLHINAHLDNIIVDGETHAAGSVRINTTFAPAKYSATGQGAGWPGGFTVINEVGKEAIYLPQGGRILGASQTANQEQQPQYIDNSTHVYNMPPGLSAVGVASAIRNYTRRGGR